MTVIVATLRRGGGGTSPFPTTIQEDAKLPHISVADLTERDQTPEWKRISRMTCFVIGENKTYRLGTDITIAGQLWTEEAGAGNVQTRDEKNQPDGYVGLNAEGYVDPQYIKSIWVQDYFTADDEAGRFALSAKTGDICHQLDNGNIYIKKNNNPPPTIAGDWANITTAATVTSVNGLIGAVQIDFDTLLSFGSSATQFESAVSGSTAVNQLSGQVANNDTDIATLFGLVDGLIDDDSSAIPLWDNLKSDYVIGNNVIYGAGGANKSLYRCTAIPPVGTAPGDTDYWELVGDFYTQQEIDDALENKADLVSGKIPVGQIPAEAFISIIVVDDWDERNNYPDKIEGQVFYVIDASGDPLVISGPKEYIYYPSNPTADEYGFIPKEVGASTSAKNFTWTWADGVDFGGTHLDFIITTATSDNEIGSIASSILFVGSALQVGNFTLQTTNFVNDTIRIPGTAGEREGTVQVVLFYNRSGIGISDTGLQKRAIGPTLAIPFDFSNTTKIDPLTITGPTEFTVVIADPDTDYGNWSFQRITANGVVEDIPTHAHPFQKWLASRDFNNTPGIVNVAARWFDGISYYYAWGQAEPIILPAMTGLVVAANNQTCELSFNKATYANDDSTGDLQLSDFGTATLTGGTATSPVLSNPVHSAGDSSITFDLSYTGTADGNEVLEIPVADGASIYDVGGVPMDSGESAVDNLNIVLIILMEDDFTGVTIDTGKWTVTDPVDDVAISQNNQLIFTTQGAGLISWDLNNLESILSASLDFVIAIDIVSSSNWVSKNYGLSIVSSVGNTVIALRAKDNTGEDADVIFTDSDGTSIIAPNTVFVGALPTKTWKIRHKSNILYFEYWNGSSWIIAHSVATAGKIDADLKMILQCGDAGNAVVSTTVLDKASITNVNYLTQYPV